MATNPLGTASAAFFDHMRKGMAQNGRYVRTAALVLVREIKLELSHPGTGRWYGKHHASAPGQPPAVDTGVLRNTIDFEVQPDAQKVRVGSGQTYAPYLEFGTDRMAARPFMRTAFARAKKQMTDAVVHDMRLHGTR